jgi:hypothetical protein
MRGWVLSVTGIRQAASRLSAKDPAEDRKQWYPECMKLLALLVFSSFVWGQSSTVSAPPASPAVAAPASSTAAVPSVYLGGITVNQTSSPKWNAVVGGLYQTGSVITSGTFANLLPVQQTNATTRAPYWAVSASITQAAFLTPYSGTNFRLLTGGSLGASFTQASPSGTNVSVAATFSAIPMFYFGKSKWGLALPIQGIYSNGLWIPVFSVTPFYSPGR